MTDPVRTWARQSPGEPVSFYEKDFLSSDEIYHAGREKEHHADDNQHRNNGPEPLDDLFCAAMIEERHEKLVLSH